MTAVKSLQIYSEASLDLGNFVKLQITVDFERCRLKSTFLKAQIWKKTETTTKMSLTWYDQNDNLSNIKLKWYETNLGTITVNSKRDKDTNMTVILYNSDNLN